MPVALCPEAIVNSEFKLWDNTLLGNFVGRRPPFSVVKEALLKQWSCSGGTEVLLLESGFFVFRFSAEEDKLRVLERGLWIVERKPIILRPWSPYLNLAWSSLSSIPAWVNLPGLPFHLWIEEALTIIESNIGIPLFTDRWTKTKERLSYAQLCVDISADKDLIDMVEIMEERGSCYPQSVIHDRRTIRCYHCKLFGHSKDKCAMQVKDLNAAPNGGPSPVKNSSTDDGFHMHLSRRRQRAPKDYVPRRPQDIFPEPEKVRCSDDGGCSGKEDNMGQGNRFAS
ncbi:uncharacterized protein LOC122077891 [Macadamia integrifolia]|uniref:uncharacterized protein LOC122077891 n=1 Tax=Macadamia integrifolia TaxID=60698 RepID=UPI001C501188|nr:uncharacterized protein LOC122077891 [Macadamia integrifolia]